MDVYAEIRELHTKGCSERAIARTLHIHRKTVHKYINGSIMPGERPAPSGRASTVLTQEVKDFVAQCFEQDKQEETIAFSPGDAMQGDRGEATSYIAGERVVLKEALINRSTRLGGK